ncbi:hypothetical protein Zmor_021717 [Zophobas morio]|uniref:Uncharacterized protein n=1 Tax=Zophobas morio TaxID=2755281 RepID=A0AA38MB92_9CUCU|nr:hypothetical protein Zmor_021717 [Zophobas morio]
MAQPFRKKYQALGCDPRQKVKLMGPIKNLSEQYVKHRLLISLAVGLTGRAITESDRRTKLDRGVRSGLCYRWRGYRVTKPRPHILNVFFRPLSHSY